jgi:hypothetical protein
VRFFLTTFPLRRATFDRRVDRGLQLSWVRIFLEVYLFRHATAARRDTFLQAAANNPLDPQSLRVSSFGFPRRPAAIRRPLCRFFIVLDDFTAASSVGTSRHPIKDRRESFRTGSREESNRDVQLVAESQGLDIVEGSTFTETVED